MAANETRNKLSAGARAASDRLPGSQRRHSFSFWQPGNPVKQKSISISLSVFIHCPVFLKHVGTCVTFCHRMPLPNKLIDIALLFGERFGTILESTAVCCAVWNGFAETSGCFVPRSEANSILCVGLQAVWDSLRASLGKGVADRGCTEPAPFVATAGLGSPAAPFGSVP